MSLQALLRGLYFRPLDITSGISHNIAGFSPKTETGCIQRCFGTDTAVMLLRMWLKGKTLRQAGKRLGWTRRQRGQMVSTVTIGTRKGSVVVLR